MQGKCRTEIYGLAVPSPLQVSLQAAAAPLRNISLALLAVLNPLARNPLKEKDYGWMIHQFRHLSHIEICIISFVFLALKSFRVELFRGGGPFYG